MSDQVEGLKTPANAGSPPIVIVPARKSLLRRRPNTGKMFEGTDSICVLVATLGLLCLAMSPFLRWVNLGAGGIVGIAGDGKLLLGAAALSAILFIAAVRSRPVLATPLIIVQGVGTVTVFWMGTLIWRLSSLLEPANAKANPFAAMLTAVMVSPGAGLYCALVGGFAVAASVAWLLLRQPRYGPALYAINQTIFVALGILLAIWIGAGHSLIADTSANSPQANSPDNGPLSTDNLFGTRRQDVRGAWKKKHGVTDKQCDEMIATYKARKRPVQISDSDWWEEAQSRTPAQMNDLYPPLEPHEWYFVKWSGGFSGSRKLDRDINFSNKPSTYSLKLSVRLDTEPGIPIKEVHGVLFFTKGRAVVYQTEISYLPDVSFSDSCFIWHEIDPYDDDNPTHRELRYATDEGLSPHFKVKRIVLADGQEKTFDR